MVAFGFIDVVMNECGGGILMGAGGLTQFTTL
jgi:hypothetical protein